MKHTEKELDVDFIGDQNGLTKDEGKAISDFINSRRAKEIISHSKKSESVIPHSKRRLAELVK